MIFIYEFTKGSSESPSLNSEFTVGEIDCFLRIYSARNYDAEAHTSENLRLGNVC